MCLLRAGLETTYWEEDEVSSRNVLLSVMTEKTTKSLVRILISPKNEAGMLTPTS
jgi:hypothetical protein